MSTFSLIAWPLILIMAAFFSTQGAFSALIMLVNAAFSSFLAIGIGLSVAHLIPASQAEYADGLGFFAVFVVSMVVLRVISNLLLPKNVGLPKWPDVASGGVVGFFAALIIVGTMTVGLEMMPFGTSILGSPTVEETGVTGRPFAARFVTGMYYLANGGSLGGTRLASVHPDLGGELTRKRNTARPSVRQTLPKSFVDISGAYYATDDRLAQFGMKRDDGSQVLVIRSKIDQGPGQHADAESSYDLADGGTGAFFDVTPAQVRMVCQKGGDFVEVNPVGYLDKGTVFKKLSVSGSEVLIEDYKDQSFQPEKDQTYADKTSPGQALIPSPPPTKAGATGDTHSLVFIDWVFEIPDGSTPVFMEFKRGGVVSLAGDVISQDKVFQPLAAVRYPPREDRNNQPIVTLHVALDGEPVKNASVWVLKPMFPRKEFSSMLSSAKDTLEKNANQDAENPWPQQSSDPGVPPMDQMRTAYRAAVDDVQNKAMDADVEWKKAIEVLFYGQMERSGRANVKNLADFFNNKLAPEIENAAGKILTTHTNAKGTTDPMTIPVGPVSIIVVATSPTAVHVWIIDATLARKDVKDLVLPPNGKDASGVTTYEIDLNKKN